MADLVDRISSDDKLFVIFITILLLIVISILISLIRDNKKEKEEKLKELKELDFLDDLEEEKVSEVEKEQAKLELERVVSQMAVDAKKEKTDTYEEEQEDNAIINYHELLNATRGIREEHQSYFDDIKNDYLNDSEFEPLHEEVVEEPSEVIVEVKTDDEGQEFDSSDIRSVLSEKSHLNVKEETIEEKPITYGTNRDSLEFRNSQFISPIHGTKGYPANFKFEENTKIADEPVQEIVEEIEYEDEKTLKFEGISDNIENNDDFLESLKKLRNNISQ